MKKIILIILILLNIPAWVWAFNLVTGSSMAVSGGCNGSTIQEYTSGNGYATMFYYSGYYWYYGTFTAADTTPICTIEAEIYKVGSPTGNITAYIYAVSSGAPTGSALATSSTVVDASTLPSSSGGTYASWSIAFTPTASTHYAIVLYKPSNSNTNYVRWGVNVTISGEAIGYSGNGTSWTVEDSSASVNFRTKS